MNNFRPDLNGIQCRQIIRALSASKRLRSEAIILLYDPIEELSVIGRVEDYNLRIGWFQVEGERFSLANIISTEHNKYNYI